MPGIAESETVAQPLVQISPALHGSDKRSAEALSIGFLTAIAAISSLRGASLIFFPELAALAYDVFTRPRGAWASSLRLLMFTPALTAVIGVIGARNLPYGYGSVLLVVGLSLIAVQVLRSPIAPAISAAVLPLALGLKSWWYPPAILFGTSFLALLGWGWRTWWTPRMPVVPPTRREVVDELMELSPRRLHWAPALLLFLLVATTLVKLTGMRLILFPPLVVIAYEMFAHPAICPWAKRPWRLPVACTLAALCGYFLTMIFGPGMLATLFSLLLGIGILRILDLHIPPALAVALIPQVMDKPSWTYACAVFFGTGLLVAIFYIYRAFLAKHRELLPTLKEHIT